MFRRSIRDLVKGRVYQKLVGQHRLGNHVVSQLISLLDDRDSWVCAKAAWALGEISISDAGASRDAVPKLISLLDDEDADILYNAAKALGTIEAEEALEPLHQLLQDNSGAPVGKTVAEAARETIIRIEQKIRMRKALEMLAALRAQIDSL